MVTLNVFSHSEHILRIHLSIDGVVLCHQLLDRESTQHPAHTLRQKGSAKHMLYKKNMKKCNICRS